MQSLARRWRRVSIAQKLYAVIGIMALLIVFELATLYFAMSILSAVRAFVGGEGLWSKAQKDAAFSLQRYAVTKNEQDYRAFLAHLEVNEGDHLARMELSKKHPDLDVVRQGFTQGRNHSDDIDKMIMLITRFHEIKYVKGAIEAWAKADAYLETLRDAGEAYHDALNEERVSPSRIHDLTLSIQGINRELTLVEDEFSRVLSEGSRWLESVVISLLALAVLMVEGVGLTLAFLTTRAISRDLSHIAGVAEAIGHGDYRRRANIRNEDEVGKTALAINTMGDMLLKSYSELETRVQQRTEELAKALRAREEFLSVASHELKTPLTSLSLQVQVRKMKVTHRDATELDWDRMRKRVEADEKQVNRLVQLIDNMLDISRLENRKLVLNKSACSLEEIVQLVLDRFALNFQMAGCELRADLRTTEAGWWDQSRLEQVLENLFSNAIKYAAKGPITVKVWQEARVARVSVSDSGQGIPKEDQHRIFKQFERVDANYAALGLGLGLYISSEIARLHHGHLTVQSEPGQGATFVLGLPSGLTSEALAEGVAGRPTPLT